MTPAMEYVSTRGRTPPVGFRAAVMAGLADDGGLLVPARIPSAQGLLADWSALPFTALAFEVMRLYADLPEDELMALIERAYASFRHLEVVPVVRAGPLRILELFHGPTLAFKDVALQFLGPLFEDILGRTGGRMNILGATSGDTGSAAIHSVRGRERIAIFMMHPHGRIAPLQERQMTTVLDPNVFNIAIEGTFDDCQRAMKTIFGDVEFKRRHGLGAVNSVNWARILAQIVYYFHSGLRVLRETGAASVQFAVPTGNFGDILAGYYAARMGLPIKRLILATNENDILARFINTGRYSLGQVVPTVSPSMDIQVASNFERYLYHRCGDDAGRVTRWMGDFARTGTLDLPEAPADGFPGLFVAGASATPRTLATIGRVYRDHGYLLDPHTAAGVAVAEDFQDPSAPTICLATAHPAKFPQAVREATGIEPHHPILDALAGLPARCEVLPADAGAVRAYVAAKAAASM